MQKCAMQVCKHTVDAFKELRYHSSFMYALMTAVNCFVLNVFILFFVEVYFKF